MRTTRSDRPPSRSSTRGSCPGLPSWTRRATACGGGRRSGGGGERRGWGRCWMTSERHRLGWWSGLDERTGRTEGAVCGVVMVCVHREGDWDDWGAWMWEVGRPPTAATKHPYRQKKGSENKAMSSRDTVTFVRLTRAPAALPLLRGRGVGSTSHMSAATAARASLNPNKRESRIDERVVGGVRWTKNCRRRECALALDRVPLSRQNDAGATRACLSPLGLVGPRIDRRANARGQPWFDRLSSRGNHPLSHLGSVMSGGGGRRSAHSMPSRRLDQFRKPLNNSNFSTPFADLPQSSRVRPASHCRLFFPLPGRARSSAGVHPATRRALIGRPCFRPPSNGTPPRRQAPPFPSHSTELTWAHESHGPVE